QFIDLLNEKHRQEDIDNSNIQISAHDLYLDYWINDERNIDYYLVVGNSFFETNTVSPAMWVHIGN
ncbi:MAG: hypothetical protein IIZ68_02355, partial [Clostridia bacterium]|nr:hypothetical protein [Clostridia bacterium]